jgi:hypothetical protein
VAFELEMAQKYAIIIVGEGANGLVAGAHPARAANVAEGMNVASMQVEQPAAIAPAMDRRSTSSRMARPFSSNSSSRKDTISPATRLLRRSIP